MATLGTHGYTRVEGSVVPLSPAAASCRTVSPLLLLPLPDTLADLLQVAVHQILYARHVYPPQLFERVAKYGAALRQSRMPDVNVYIAEFCAGIKSDLEKGTVAGVHVVIVDTVRAEPVERFTFQMDRLGYDASTGWTCADKDIQFMSLCQKLLVADCFMSRPTKDCTFVLYVEYRDKTSRPTPSSGLAPTNSWILAEDKSMRMDDARAVPIRTFENSLACPPKILE
ncbi:hypothetical protein SeLEV6574_g00756 [Synchytrium endobioticum]|uniref:HORMA domain-containing protein n=1 Tax=Synchytrium endobioticum TaxID=286115 RepID=A0A507DG94_9FUNG|nr:hypothetical protein SeLEV6574_g00756 [Synchytrium endobioticum]